MALVASSNSVTSSLLSSSFSSSSAVTAIPCISRLQINSIDPHPTPFNGFRLQTQFVAKRTRSVIVKASSDVDGANVSTEAVSETKEAAVSVENLPLESKVKVRTEQQEKMRLAKKIRLRRKRLVRKRKLRKKGRWPPSKMKKLKNV